MHAENTDRQIQELRAQISDNDRAIVRALNKRVELVARLKRYKESQGLEFVDPKQEESVLRDLSRANRGPLSQDGLRELYREILELTKREVSG
ncbi:MAG TPA: chorismate mutase [Gaiellaceae bacterium]|jgi:chorismate mutase|nr:chorismate mutase [Gaiellaceae bacterium]